MSPLPRIAPGVDFDRYLRTNPEPDGMTELDPMRFAVVTGETYGRATVSIPVAVVFRAPAPPAPATWPCIRQSIGPEQHWLAWVPADRVRAR